MADNDKVTATEQGQKIDTAGLKNMLSVLPNIKQATQLLKDSGIDVSEAESVIEDVDRVGLSVLKLAEKANRKMK